MQCKCKWLQLNLWWKQYSSGRDGCSGSGSGSCRWTVLVHGDGGDSAGDSMSTSVTLASWYVPATTFITSQPPPQSSTATAVNYGQKS